MDVRSLSPQNDFTATRYTIREDTTGSSTDRPRNQTHLGRLHTFEATECITLRDSTLAISARAHAKAILAQPRRRSDDSNGTVARNDISGDAESDVETDTDTDIGGGDRIALSRTIAEHGFALYAGRVRRRESFDRRFIQSPVRLSDPGSAASGLENPPSRRFSSPAPALIAGNAGEAVARVTGGEGVCTPVSKRRKRSSAVAEEAGGERHKRAKLPQANSGSAADASNGAYATAPVIGTHRHLPVGEISPPISAPLPRMHEHPSSWPETVGASAAATLITPAGTVAGSGLARVGGGNSAHNNNSNNAHARENSAVPPRHPPPPPPQQPSSAVVAVTAARGLTSSSAAPPSAFTAATDVSLTPCTLPVGKLRSASDASASRVPSASDSPADLAGCAFVPAGKVSNGHVVGRVPIGFTPFYPTIDLQTGKHAVMQVFNGPLKSDFLRYELRMMHAVAGDDGTGSDSVLRVLDVVDHGDAVLVFREPFVSDLHTQLRKSGRFDEEIAREYFTQMVAAVAEMHAKDIVLGASLRLNSVVLASKDMVTLKLASLEAAHSTDGVGRSEPEPLATATCLAYAPPEQVGRLQASAALDNSDKSCDIWALGVMLFSMLNGSFPFVSMKTDPDAARDEICEKIMAGKWMLPNQPRFTLAAHALLRMLLNPSPDQRPSAEAILSHPWVSASTVLSANTMPRAYDACPAAAFASSASDSLLCTMQARSVAADDQCVPCC